MHLMFFAHLHSWKLSKIQRLEPSCRNSIVTQWGHVIALVDQTQRKGFCCAQSNENGTQTWQIPQKWLGMLKLTIFCEIFSQFFEIIRSKVLDLRACHIDLKLQKCPYDMASNCGCNTHISQTSLNILRVQSHEVLQGEPRSLEWRFW